MSVAQARRLRRNSTDAERALWARLRNRSLAGHKFRWQHPIGPYVVDFVCILRKLVIELDGGQHAQNLGGDVSRTKWLERQGYRVLRFWNNEVLQNIEGVLEAIRTALEAAPHPNPLPDGERER